MDCFKVEILSLLIIIIIAKRRCFHQIIEGSLNCPRFYCSHYQWSQIDLVCSLKGKGEKVIDRYCYPNWSQWSTFSWSVLDHKICFLLLLMIRYNKLGQPSTNLDHDHRFQMLRDLLLSSVSRSVSCAFRYLTLLSFFLCTNK